MSTPYEILEVAYDNFLAEFILAMKEAGYTLNDACDVWCEEFGDDSQDALVDWAFAYHYDWAVADAD